ADDHVLQAVDDVVVAVGIALSDVAGVEPAIADRLRGRLGTAPVALHDVVPAHHDLAGVVVAEQLAVVAHDPDLGTHDRHADAAGYALGVEVIEGGDRTGLRKAVTYQDH